MAGYNAQTGEPIYGDDRIVQSIRRLVVTHGDLVMRRHLTCVLPDMIDTPGNAAERLLVCSQVATAIHDGEPRADLRSIQLVAPIDATQRDEAISRVADGENGLVLEAYSTETGKLLDFGGLIS
ncbi:hypothetical protein [uncultured Cohaesibacter sp.]|uniref:hypothetical protein n=1 Tax=uncultured Cohaesibacter sp. TaxID=1002546 RepID=UPI002AABA286|nr:hypothetical protein [uncultured Cohaesibacter sp.]